MTWHERLFCWLLSWVAQEIAPDAAGWPNERETPPGAPHGHRNTGRGSQTA